MTLPITARLRLFYLLHFSKPSGNRLVYRAIHRKQAKRIVEFGVGVGQRALRMIETASLDHPAEEVHYTGIDPFEARSESGGPGVTLKMAYMMLQESNAKVRLLPGDPFAALSRAFDRLGEADVVFISASVDGVSMRRAWLYLARMLHKGSQVFLEEAHGPGERVTVRQLTGSQIREFAAAGMKRAA
jgi:predicted O-methyltransferase YrrM